jgi:hypothetical protein
VNGGSWEPDRRLVRELKAQLGPYVKATARAQGRELRNWSEYIFQYQGLEEKGRKYVLERISKIELLTINDFC